MAYQVTDTATTLVAQINVLITDASDGTKTVDINALAELLELYIASGVDINPNGYTGSRPERTAADALSMAQELAYTLSKEKWMTEHPADWPTGALDSSKQQLIDELDGAQGELWTLAKEVIYHFEDKIADAALTGLAEQYFTDHVVPNLPEVVERIVESRTYVYTHVTDWGEESAPSPAIEVFELDQNDTVTVTATSLAAPNVTHWRLYRSNTGTQSSAFQFVTEQPVVNTSFVDDLPADRLGEVCPTFGWLPPPDTLQGLVSLPNGVMAGFSVDTLYFSVPYKPYAWPLENTVPLPVPVVGLAPVAGSLAVGTRGNPYVVSGTDPESMVEQLVEIEQACVSKRSMVTTGDSAIYAGPDGLVQMGVRGSKVLTAGILSQADWQAYQPEQMLGAVFEGKYYAFHPTGTLVWDFATNDLSSLDLVATAAFVDVFTDTLYVVNGTSVYAVFGGGGKRTGRVVTKEIRLPAPASMAWLHVDAEYPGTVNVTVRGDGAIIHTIAITSADPVRMPPGMYTDYEIEISSTIGVTSIVLASSVAELRSLG